MAKVIVLYDDGYIEKKREEKKRLLCSVASPSEIRHKIENQNTIPYQPAPFPVFVTRI